MKQEGKEGSLAIVREEHRAQMAILQAMQLLVRQRRQQNRPVGVGLLEAGLDCLERSLAPAHRRKLDEVLFPVLRVRDPDSRPILDSLERQHQAERQMLAQLREALAGIATQPSRLAAFDEALADYAEFQRFHILQEGEVALHSARCSLRGSDWDVVDAAFAREAAASAAQAVQRRLAAACRDRACGTA